MKKFLSISILVLWVNNVFAQANTNWVDSILTMIILNEIEVFDENLKVIKNAEIELISKDTVVNCLWTRPKYMDHILQGSFDGVVIEDQIVFDTSSNQKNNQYIDFKFPISDENGNYLNDTIAFTIKRKSPRKQNYEFARNDNLINTAWKIDKIINKGRAIELDSCHKNFNLILNQDFTFVQQFGDDQGDCSTKSMNKNKEVGVEGDYDEFMDYHDKIQGHYLSVKKGIWKMEGNNLLLIDLNEKRTLSFKIKKLNSEKLYLNLEELDCTIKLKEANMRK